MVTALGIKVWNFDYSTKKTVVRFVSSNRTEVLFKKKNASGFQCAA